MKKKPMSVESIADGYRRMMDRQDVIEAAGE
jgi:hypothetical protein